MDLERTKDVWGGSHCQFCDGCLAPAQGEKDDEREVGDVH